MEELIVGFDYTIWANKKWVEVLPQFPDRARPEEVLRHMSYWQRTWLQRASLHIAGEEVDLLENVPIGDALEQGARDWQNFLYRHAEQDVSFVRQEGGEYSISLHRIAKQLVFHSVYHRGHLRGLAESAGVEDFPDTDWFYFCADQERWQ